MLSKEDIFYLDSLLSKTDTIETLFSMNYKLTRTVEELFTNL